MAVIPLAAFNGILDLATVAVAARLAASLVGKNLSDTIPGIQFFNSSVADQTLQLVILLAIFSWLGSSTKLVLKVFQERLNAQLWRDFSDRILCRIVG